MVDKEHVAAIVSAYTRKSTLAADQLPPLITAVHAALARIEGGGTPESEEELIPAVSIRRSVQQEALTCLDCGHRGKLLKRHLQRAHGLNPDGYRERWGLKPDYPMVAPAYANRRSELAKALGLGRSRRA
jgi:predicted transcriptional regulator